MNPSKIWQYTVDCCILSFSGLYKTITFWNVAAVILLFELSAIDWLIQQLRLMLEIVFASNGIEYKFLQIVAYILSSYYDCLMSIAHICNCEVTHYWYVW